MKVVFFDFIHRYGGGPQLAADTMVRLSRHYEVTVIDPYGQSEPYIQKLRDGGVKVHILMPESRFIFLGSPRNPVKRLWRLFLSLPHYLRLRRRLVEMIRAIGPDVIWTNTKPGFKFLTLCGGLDDILLTTEIIGCHPASYYDDGIGHKMKKRLDLVMAISTETGKQLEAAGFDPEKIHVVYDTIDFEETLRKSRQPLEAPLPGQGRHPAILVPATLIPKKGQDTAIKAVARLKAQGLEPVLWLAGDVVGLDNSYEVYLKQLAAKLHVVENVHFLGWRSDVPAILLQADMMVLPTHEEGFGHVILEAMLLKRPALATPVGGIMDSIYNGLNGLNFAVADDERLAEQILKVYNNPSLAERIVESGYKTVTERFTPEAHTAKVMEGLERMSKSKKEFV
jgi:glycosyltransferase involved in cell wall biosynthesis